MCHPLRNTLASAIVVLIAPFAHSQVLLYSNPLPFAQFAAVLGDVNGNGTADHFHISQVAPGTHAIDIREGEDGSLIRQIPIGAISPSFIDNAGDIDLDGSHDIVHLAGTPFAPLDIYASGSGLILFSIPSPAPASFGHAFSIGDTNLDGWPDLVVSVGGGGITGHLQIRSGFDGSLLRVLPYGIPSAAGDVDGDGCADVLISRTNFLVPATIGVHSGATGALIRTLAVPPAPSGAFPYLFVDAGVDFDGDGVPDACVSAPDPQGVSMGIGTVYVYSLATGAILHSFTGPGNQANGARFLGDVNGDGVNDFLLFTIFTPYVVDGVTASARPLINYPNGCSNTPRPIIGDVTHDGIGDVIVYHCQFGSPWNGYDVVSPTSLQPAEQRLLGLGRGPTLTLSSPPIIGTVPTLTVTGASPGMSGFLWAGPRAPNPISLGNLCALHLDLPLSSQVAVFNIDPAGNWTTALPIPATTALIDVRLTLQAALVTPGLSVTNALFLRLGY